MGLKQQIDLPIRYVPNTNTYFMWSELYSAGLSSTLLTNLLILRPLVKRQEHLETFLRC